MFYPFLSKVTKEICKELCTLLYFIWNKELVQLIFQNPKRSHVMVALATLFQTSEDSLSVNDGHKTKIILKLSANKLTPRANYLDIHFNFLWMPH